MYRDQVALYGERSTRAAVIRAWIGRVHAYRGRSDAAVAETEHARRIWTQCMRTRIST